MLPDGYTIVAVNNTMPKSQIWNIKISARRQNTLDHSSTRNFRSTFNQAFTNRSDVHSFYVTLVELLTQKTSFSFAIDKDKNQVSTFYPQVTKDALEKDVEAMAELAMRCLRLSGKINGVRRPEGKKK
ncbi:hypothetical protein F8388_012757 [Cannabis sativa]|nr:hypothetical protein F8388_012757 [Cannabis sativa]